MAYIDHVGVWKPPDFGAPIWRYMDLPSFVSLLRGRMFFRRMSAMPDRFEGTWTRPSLAWWAEHNEKIRQLRPDITVTTPEQLRRIIAGYRNASFINCWSANPIESATMWAQYAPCGIAIKSTIARLRDSIRYVGPHYVGQVRYLDFDADVIVFDSVFRPLLTKRAAYQDEREIRAFLCDWEMIAEVQKTHATTRGVVPGESVGVSLDGLITEVRVAPQSQPWFLDTVKWLCGQAGLGTIQVVASALDAEPA
jgi:hypothetical protein